MIQSQMKAIRLLVLTVVTGLALNTPAPAQKKVTEGTIVFAISYEKSNVPEEYASMMPTEMTMYFKSDKSRTEMSGGMGMSTAYIYDNKARSMTMMMDVMGRKLAVKHTEADVKKYNDKSNKDLTVEKTGKTKEIAGYLCKHAVIKSRDGDFDLYYCPDLFVKDNEWTHDFKGIDGIPLEYIMEQQDMKMNLTAKKVVVGPVDDSKFIVPEGYENMTADEMMKSFGHGK